MKSYLFGVHLAFSEAQSVLDGTGNHSFRAVYRGGTINIHTDYLEPGLVGIDWYPDIFMEPEETEIILIPKTIAEFSEYTVQQMLADFTPAMITIAQQVRNWVQRFDSEVC